MGKGLRRGDGSKESTKPTQSPQTQNQTHRHRSLGDDGADVRGGLLLRDRPHRQTGLLGDRQLDHKGIDSEGK